MQLVVSPEILEVFPALRIGILIAEDIDNAGQNDDLERLKVEKADEFRMQYTSHTLLDNPYIAAWRDTYRRFGTNPKKNKPTAEALLRRIVRGHDIPTISKAVDLYLVVETQFYLPIGGYDLDKIVGDIHLRFSPGGEDFMPLGATQVEEQTSSGEVVYADDVQILTRKWNYRDCDLCKITSESTRIALFTEAALDTIPTEHLAKSLELLEGYMLRFCGGSVRTILADANKLLKWDLV